jgi:hypothetical protein
VLAFETFHQVNSELFDTRFRGEGFMRRSQIAGFLLSVMLVGTGLSQSKLPVTKATADRKDMVTAGAVIDLMKDNLLMSAVTEPRISEATYKDGKFSYGAVSSGMKWLNKTKSGADRTFVAGEKFWLIGVKINDDAAVLEFLSDPISDVRYKAFVKYPFPKGGIPAPDVVVAQIKESIKAEPTDGKGGDQAAAAPAPAAPAAPPPPAMADIPPPPPPTDAPPAAPKTISLGQTHDVVAATFGAPTKVVKAGAKEIDYYPDMKVTFVNGKVTDVQ